MKLIEISYRIVQLDEKIYENMKFLKENKDNSNTDEFKEKVEETASMMCELEFYKNQFEDIEKYFDIQFY